ncbi:hypothetical protein Tco_0435706 [Tanacetum coccineum]
MTNQNEDRPRCIAWSTEEEIVLCKGWVHVSEYSAIGNAGRENGFWNEILPYPKRKTKAIGRRTYDMVNKKWKTVCSNMARFCGVHANVMRRAPKRRGGDGDYFAKALLDY